MEGLGNTVVSYFGEVSGLDTDTQAIEYRHGNNQDLSVTTLPGLRKVGNVTLRRGVFAKDTTFWDWYSRIRTNRLMRQTVIIRLLDKASKPVITWTLTNA